MKRVRFWLGKLNLRRSFRSRLGAAIATTILIFSMLLAAVVGEISQAQAQSDRGERMAQLAYQLAGALDRDMYIYYHELQTVALLDDMRSPTQPAESKRVLLERLQESFSDFAWIGLTNPKGVVLASTHRLLEGANVAERPWFVEGQTQANVQNVHPANLLANLLPNPSREPIRLVDIATPVRTLEGELMGVLGAHLYWQWATTLRDNLLIPLQDYGQVDIQILANTGQVLLSPNQDQSYEQFSPNLFQPLVSFQAALQGQTGFVVEPWFDDNTYVTGYAATQGYRTYEGLGWIVLVRQSTDEAFAAASALKGSIFLWGVVLGIISGALTWWIAGQMIKPVLVIAATAERIRTGDTHISMPIFPGRDEIAQLSRSVAQLFANLEQQTTLLQQFNADLEAQVAARTDTLKQLNQQLQSEIDVRRQAELALQSANQELQRLTLVDGLTTIANRRHFDQYLEQEWRRAVREHQPFSLILLDIDYFKLYNDHYGHQAGDVCLRLVAQTIVQTIHRGTHLAARYGGEEFAVVLPSTDAYGAVYLAETLRQAVKALHLPHAKSIVSPWITLSLGIATCQPSVTLDPINLITAADARLYQAKQQGRDRIQAEP
ncbi:diguanylate cyclase [Nodosilinea sp. FACHB-131]|uniref:diguanylate cyclase domain-containing protein n=1 Tax=Cyanophyceae TaxID=3028117 RepID=UPI0016873714|nr:diguanylate cyclase [Nodosilinea sp. FACHB-131]